MLLNDYLDNKKHDRRILIVSDLARGHALIRMHEKKTEKMVHNVSCMTISQMSDVFYRYILSEKGYNKVHEFLDSTEAMMLFRSILFGKIKNMRFFNAENMMDLATVREIFNKVDLIRNNGWSGKEKEENNDRVRDLKVMVSEYEDKLASEKLMDQTAKEKYVLDKLRSFSDPKQEIQNVFSAEISCLEEDIVTFNGVEKDLLSFFQNADDPEVCIHDDELTVKSLTNCSGLEKGFQFGSVTVLFTSPAQLPAIEAALSGNGIPMRILSEYPAGDNSYISLAKRVIEWAEDDFSEKKLEKILSSRVINVQVEDGDGNRKNALSGQRYFDHVLNAGNRKYDKFVLGWGYDRNADFIRHELDIVSEESEKEVLKMHKELLGIFGDNGKAYDNTNKVRPSGLYDKLTAFIETYTVKGEDYAIGIDILRRIAGAVSFEQRTLSLEDALTFISELLSGAVMSDPADTNAVEVRTLSDWCVLDRPNVYVTGLALKDIQGNTTESPVLSDDMMENYLKKEGYVPTVKNEADRKRNSLLLTLSTFAGNSIVFGYSDYDTVSFCENNASTFFRDMLSEYGKDKIDDLPEFVYGNPEESIKTGPVPAGEESASYYVKLKTSNSALENLSDCPKKYAYGSILHLPENEFTECDHDRWLDQRLKGIFFHNIMEKYCNSHIICHSSEAYETEVDVGCVTDIANEIESEFLIEIPCAFKKLADSETENIAEAAAEYIQVLLDELNSAGWRVLTAEQRFINAIYPVRDFSGNDYDFEFSGTIDRVDYRVDRKEGKCFIRIIDYKTGKREKKESEIELGKALQHAIYKKAVMESGKTETGTTGVVDMPDHICDRVAELEEDESVKNYKYEFECFQYVFPMEKKNPEPIEICEADLEGDNIVRLKSVLTIINNENVYPDHKEFKEYLENLANEYPADSKDINTIKDLVENKFKKETKNCEYCSYEHLCINRKAGEIK